MNRDKQIVKDIANKHAQAREEYAKNKALLKESIIKEKIDDSIYQEGNNTHEETPKNPTNKKTE